MIPKGSTALKYSKYMKKHVEKISNLCDNDFYRREGLL